jgi:hypothetical protein
MKRILGISLSLNLALLSSLTYLLAKHYKTATVPVPASSGMNAPAPATTISAPTSPRTLAEALPPFRWSDLDSSNGYQGFVANLRAIGCPEKTIADIVRGNVDRAFSWERAQLHLDGSGGGSWSQAKEVALINNLLGNPSTPQASSYSQNSAFLVASPRTVPTQNVASTPQSGNSQAAQLSAPQSYSQNAQTSPSASSWVAQGGAWNANAALTATVSANQSSGGQGQQSDANGESRQNLSSWPQLSGDPNSADSEPNDPNSEPNNTPTGPTAPRTSQNDQPNPNDPYTWSSQDIMAQQQAEYYEWYEPQVLADTANGAFLTINPDEFHPTQ